MNYKISENNNLLTRTGKRLISNGMLGKLEQLEKAIAGRSFSSFEEYALVLRDLLGFAQTFPNHKDFPIFDKEKEGLGVKSPLIEKTNWGGVSIKKVNVYKDSIKKFLIIKQFGLLGFEKHSWKNEHLTVAEGYCFVISAVGLARNDRKKIQVTFAVAGDKFSLRPGTEHGIIAVTNCVIIERSTNKLDDLEYVYKAATISSMK